MTINWLRQIQYSCETYREFGCLVYKASLPKSNDKSSEVNLFRAFDSMNRP
uniref:Uncharacterized protein n=1 Tax=Anguilla anguilla TaxID=7936 RepID=A0A0E9UP97_ANGAN